MQGNNIEAILKFYVDTKSFHDPTLQFSPNLTLQQAFFGAAFESSGVVRDSRKAISLCKSKTFQRRFA